MKNIIGFLFFFIFIFFIFDCSHEENNYPVTNKDTTDTTSHVVIGDTTADSIGDTTTDSVVVNYAKILNYKFYLSKADLSFQKVCCYTSDSVLKYTYIYNYRPNMVERVYLPNDFSGILVKTTYSLNSIGLADNIIDSTFNPSFTDRYFIKNYYDKDGYKIRSIKYKNPSDTLLYGYRYYDYFIVNGNTTSIHEELYHFNNLTKFIRFKFSGRVNKIDITGVIGDYAGKKNSNLVELLYRSSTTSDYGFKTYTYIINLEGFVIQMKEAEKEAINDPEIYNLYRFEYIFQ